MERVRRLCMSLIERVGRGNFAIKDNVLRMLKTQECS